MQIDSSNGLNFIFATADIVALIWVETVCKICNLQRIVKSETARYANFKTEEQDLKELYCKIAAGGALNSRFISYAGLKVNTMYNERTCDPGIQKLHLVWVVAKSHFSPQYIGCTTTFLEYNVHIKM